MVSRDGYKAVRDVREAERVEKTEGVGMKWWEIALMIPIVVTGLAIGVTAFVTVWATMITFWSNFIDDWRNG